ncbi:hypothetical protein [Actinoplanes xinjiangensis]|uniref:hypothetical protein n=1 Tax=Actinoplanes xinjiangensis TaxID=512350 RepID=UPI003421AF14
MHPAVLAARDRWTAPSRAAVSVPHPIGFPAGALAVDSAPAQTVTGVTPVGAGGVTLGGLPPVVFSELVHDLRVPD